MGWSLWVVSVRTGVDPVKIVQIRSESESVNRSLDVFFDMAGRVGDSALGSEDVKSTFGGHCTGSQC